MSEIIFGTPEHVAGLSRKALEEDFRWVNDRRMELEGECERLDAENAKLRELAERAWKTAERLCQAFDGPCSDDGVTIAKPCPMDGRDEECIYGQLQKELLELGIEVDG